MNMKGINKIKIGLLGMCVGLLASCKTDPNVPKTVPYISAGEDFKVLSTSTNMDSDKALNFEEDSLKFMAEFSQPVTWSLRIQSVGPRGEVASKILNGTSQQIDPSTFFDGSSENVYFFKKGEALDIRLSFLGADTIVNLDGFTVSETKDFSATSNLILDFQTGQDSKALLNTTDDVNLFFDTDGGDEEIEGGKYVTTSDVKLKSVPLTVEGDRFIYLRGKDEAGKPGTFFIGGFNNASRDFGLDGAVDEIFLNFYANSNGNRTTKLVLEILGVGGDAFRSEKDVTWTGWRLVSIRLSDFVSSNSAPIGTGVLSPNLISDFAFQIHSGAGVVGNESEIMIDYVTFTKGAPFSQSN